MPLAGFETSTEAGRPQHEGSRMKPRTSSIGLLILMTSVLVAATAVAAPNRNPFRAIWRAIADLQAQIDDISSTPAPQNLNARLAHLA